MVLSALPGVGDRLAKKITDHFGDEQAALDSLRCGDIARVAEIDGVSPKRALSLARLVAGDSGSFLCARIPISVAGGDPWDGTVTYSEWKIIGHHFAGSSGVYSIATRIDNMAEDLDIRAYRGAGTLEFATLENKQTRITTGYSSDLTMTYDGKKYWQAGKTNAPAEDAEDV